MKFLQHIRKGGGHKCLWEPSKESVSITAGKKEGTSPLTVPIDKILSVKKCAAMGLNGFIFQKINEN